MKKFIIALIVLLLLPTFAAAESGFGELVRCELSLFGGMENEDTSYVAARGDSRRESVLTVRERGVSQEIPLPYGALDDLSDYLAACRPETWADLPEREEQALDAPSLRIDVTCSDGAAYTLYDDRETDRPVFYELRCFLESYLAQDAGTFALSFDSFDGGGPEYRAVLSAPEKVWVSTSRQYDEPYDEMATGSGYRETLTFHGRIPGRCELRIEGYSPLMSFDDAPQTIYVLEVDGEYNVRIVEERSAEGEGENTSEEAEEEPESEGAGGFFSLFSLFGLVKRDSMTVGEEIGPEDITEFYYTYATSTYPPEYQRYRFYAENGGKYFDYETREGDRWPLEEEDRTVYGTIELSEEAWQAFFDLLRGGAVRRREENLDSGDPGPWLYLYWNGDGGAYQEYTFASWEALSAFEDFCAGLAER